MEVAIVAQQLYCRDVADVLLATHCTIVALQTASNQSLKLQGLFNTDSIQFDKVEAMQTASNQSLKLQGLFNTDSVQFDKESKLCRLPVTRV